MADNVVQLKPCVNLSTALRNIADSIESGELDYEEITLIADTDVYHMGIFDDGKAATNAVFNMTFGIHKLMQPILYGEEEE